MKIAYDVGMNNGSDTGYLLKKGYRVIAIEANPGLCKLVQTAYANEWLSGQLMILNICISDKLGQVPFYINKTNDVLSGTARPAGDIDVKEIMVEAKQLSAIVTQYGLPDLIKI